jgi:hypothetical protein
MIRVSRKAVKLEFCPRRRARKIFHDHGSSVAFGHQVAQTNAVGHNEGRLGAGEEGRCDNTHGDDQTGPDGWHLVPPQGFQ